MIIKALECRFCVHRYPFAPRRFPFLLYLLPRTRTKAPLPGMMPYSLILTVNVTSMLCLTLGDFDGQFLNHQIDQQTALGFNRYFLGQFAHFPQVRHLITGRENLVEDMAWAHHALARDGRHTITFHRQQTPDKA